MAVRDLDDDDEAKKAPAKSPSQMKLVIVGALALFVAVLGAQVAAPLINRFIEGGPAVATTADETLDEDAELIEEASARPVSLKPAVYVALDPPFVVSFNDESGARYLQLTLQAMARSDQTAGEIKRHAPAIRNAFLFLLSSFGLGELTTVEGKEKLRGAMLVAANDILAKNGAEPNVEELFFTSLVIQ
jgi:flagellar FliL protein